MMTFICFIGVGFTFAFLDCVRFNEDFVISRFAISRFCSIHFTVTLAGLKNIVCYTEVPLKLEIFPICLQTKEWS